VTDIIRAVSVSKLVFYQTNFILDSDIAHMTM